MNQPNAISDTDTTPEQHGTPGRRQGERPEERREGERRHDDDDERDPDFARGEDRRQQS